MSIKRTYRAILLKQINLQIYLLDKLILSNFSNTYFLRKMPMRNLFIGEKIKVDFN